VVPAPAPRPARSTSFEVEPLTAELRRAIWERDGGRCQWKLEGGGIYGSRCRVELDHIEPFARGGRITTPDDGRLLCKFHQDVFAREVYGDAIMDRYTKPKGGPHCSEPVAV
jgi:hypothetical protein